MNNQQRDATWLLLKGSCIIIPAALGESFLTYVNEEHLGVAKANSQFTSPSICQVGQGC